MTERVFLHVGGPKTGTTYLQDVMLGNREILAQQGVWYVGTRWIDHVHASLVVREHRRLRSLDDEAAGAWDRFVAEALGFDGRTAVISHETLGVATADQASRAITSLAPAEVHVIFNARDFVSQVAATWQEHLKYRFATPMSSWNPEKTSGAHAEWSFLAIDPVGVLDRWGRDLPPERVHLLTVPPSGSAADELWRRFAGIVGIDPASCDLSVARPNASLGVVEAELLRRVNAHLGPPITGAQEVARWIRGNLVGRVLGPRKGRRFGLGDEQAAHLADLADDRISTLATSGYDIVGDLDDLRPRPRSPGSVEHPEDVADSELLAAATESMAELVLLLRERTIQRDSARATVRRLRSDEAAPSGDASDPIPADSNHRSGALGRLREKASRLRRR